MDDLAAKATGPPPHPEQITLSFSQESKSFQIIIILKRNKRVLDLSKIYKLFHNTANLGKERTGSLDSYRTSI